MSNRTSECYTAVFNFIENEVFKMEPTEIITDFEAGMRNAINTVYKNVTLRGCWFHYCCAIKRMALKLGLRNVLKTMQEARFVYYKLMSLPLLPTEQFLNGYQYIKAHAQRKTFWSNFQSLFEYFESFWIAQVRIRILLINR